MTTNEQAEYTPTLESLRSAYIARGAIWERESRAAEFDRIVAAERHRVAEQCAQIAERWINAMAGSSSPDEAAWPGYWEAKRWVADNVPDEIRAAFPASGGILPPAVAGEGFKSAAENLNEAVVDSSFMDGFADGTVTFTQTEVRELIKRAGRADGQVDRIVLLNLLDESAISRRAAVSDNLPLDPEPWVCSASHDGVTRCYQRAAQAWMGHRNSNIFDPRDESRYRPIDDNPKENNR